MMGRVYCRLVILAAGLNEAGSVVLIHKFIIVSEIIVQ